VVGKRTDFKKGRDMGLLDMAKSMLGAQGTGNNQELLNLVTGLIGNQGAGGLGGLVQQFKDQGLHDVVSSWVGTGENLPVSPDQLQKVFGGQRMQEMAAKVGISPDALGGQLSQLLPKVVDHLTPNGTIPEHSAVESGLALLKNILK
jgi:uncharacterized protein YidB (DUF937 family)